MHYMIRTCTFFLSVSKAVHSRADAIHPLGSWSIMGGVEVLRMLWFAWLSFMNLGTRRQSLTETLSLSTAS